MQKHKNDLVIIILIWGIILFLIHSLYRDVEAEAIALVEYLLERSVSF